jgi:hypothetical protein
VAGRTPINNVNWDFYVSLQNVANHFSLLRLHCDYIPVKQFSCGKPLKTPGSKFAAGQW